MRLRVVVCLLACVHILRSECMCHHVPHLKYWSKKHNRALVCLFTSVHFSRHLIYLPQLAPFKGTMRLRVIVCLLARVHILRSECMYHHVPHLKYWSKKHNRTLVCLFTFVHFSQHLSIYLYSVHI